MVLLWSQPFLPLLLSFIICISHRPHSTPQILATLISVAAAMTVIYWVILPHHHHHHHCYCGLAPHSFFLPLTPFILPTPWFLYRNLAVCRSCLAIRAFFPKAWGLRETNGSAPVGWLPGLLFFLPHLIIACCFWFFVDRKNHSPSPLFPGVTLVLG